MTARYTIEELRRLLEDRVESFCERYLPGGYRDGRHWRCSDIHGAAPAGRDGDGSFVLNLTGAHPGLWHDFSSDEKGDQLDVLKAQLGSMAKAREEAMAFLGLSGQEPKRPAPPPRRKEADAEAAEERSRLLETARRIWDEATPDLSGPAELYLQGRGIWLDPWPAPIRFHRRLRFKRAEQKGGPKVYVPGLVLRVDNVAGEFIGIQRIFLDPAKPIQKHPDRANAKLSLGDIRGGAIRLRDGPTRRLRVVEGPENGASVLDMLGGEDALWAIPGASNLPGLELPEDCEELIVFGDNDPAKGKAKRRAGQESVRKLAAKALAEGKRVKGVYPGQEGVDWNDLLRQHGDAAADMVRELEAKAPWMLPTPDPEPDPAPPPDGPPEDGPPPPEPDDPGPQAPDDGRKPVESFLHLYAYVQEAAGFIDRQTGEILKKEQVRDFHKWECYGNLANLLLDDGRLLRARGVTFWPGQPEKVMEGKKDCLNLWRPEQDAVVQPRKGDIAPFLEHIEEVVDGEEIAAAYLLNWMCHVARFPGQKVHSAPLLIGHQGTGKSLLTKIMRAMFGARYVVEIGPRELESDFNDYLMQAQVLVVEEMRVKDRFEVTNRIKPWITNDSLPINPKGVRMFHMPNRTNIILYSNELGALNIEKDDRRYMVSQSRREPRDESYFSALFGWLEREGYAAIHHYLLHEHDLGEFNPKAHAPWTSAKGMVQEISASPVEMYLNSMREEGRSPFNRDLMRAEEVWMALPDKLRSNLRQVTLWMQREGGVQLGQITLENGDRPRLWAMRRGRMWAKQDRKTIGAQYTLMLRGTWDGEQATMPFDEEGYGA